MNLNIGTSTNVSESYIIAIIHRIPNYYKWSNGKLLLVSFLYLFSYTFTTFAPTITCVCFKLNHVYIISLVIIYISRRQVKVCTLET